MNNIVSMKWLLARLYEPDLVIVDCRFVLGQPESGRAAYEESHIPRAVYLDLEQDLSSLLRNMADATLCRTWIISQSGSGSRAFKATAVSSSMTIRAARWPAGYGGC